MTDQNLNEQINSLTAEMMGLYPRWAELKAKLSSHLASDQEHDEYAVLMTRISSLEKQIDALLDQEELEQQ